MRRDGAPAPVPLAASSAVSNMSSSVAARTATATTAAAVRFGTTLPPACDRPVTVVAPSDGTQGMRAPWSSTAAYANESTQNVTNGSGKRWRAPRAPRARPRRAVSAVSAVSADSPGCSPPSFSASRRFRRARRAIARARRAPCDPGHPRARAVPRRPSLLWCLPSPTCTSRIVSRAAPSHAISAMHAAMTCTGCTARKPPDPPPPTLSDVDGQMMPETAEPAPAASDDHVCRVHQLRPLGVRPTPAARSW